MISIGGVFLRSLCPSMNIFSSFILRRILEGCCTHLLLILVFGGTHYAICDAVMSMSILMSFTRPCLRSSADVFLPKALDMRPRFLSWSSNIRSSTESWMMNWIGDEYEILREKNNEINLGNNKRIIKKIHTNYIYYVQGLIFPHRFNSMTAWKVHITYIQTNLT